MVFNLFSEQWGMIDHRKKNLAQWLLCIKTFKSWKWASEGRDTGLSEEPMWWKKLGWEVVKVQVDGSVLFINVSQERSAVEDFGQANVAFFNFYFFLNQDLYCGVKKIWVSEKLVSLAIWGKKRAEEVEGRSLRGGDCAWGAWEEGKCKFSRACLLQIIFLAIPAHVCP